METEFATGKETPRKKIIHFLNTATRFTAETPHLKEAAERDGCLILYATGNELESPGLLQPNADITVEYVLRMEQLMKDTKVLSLEFGALQNVAITVTRGMVHNRRAEEVRMTFDKKGRLTVSDGWNPEAAMVMLGNAAQAAERDGFIVSNDVVYGIKTAQKRKTLPPYWTNAMGTTEQLLKGKLPEKTARAYESMGSDSPLFLGLVDRTVVRRLVDDKGADFWQHPFIKFLLDEEDGGSHPHRKTSGPEAVFSLMSQKDIRAVMDKIPGNTLLPHPFSTALEHFDETQWLTAVAGRKDLPVEALVALPDRIAARIARGRGVVAALDSPWAKINAALLASHGVFNLFLHRDLIHPILYFGLVFVQGFKVLEAYEEKLTPSQRRELIVALGNARETVQNLASGKNVRTNMQSL